MKRSVVVAAAAGTIVCSLAVAGASAAPAAAPAPLAGSWVLSASTTVASRVANQGLTTVVRAGAAVMVTRGTANVAPDLAVRGWNHVGDPGSVGGTVLDAYQSGRPVGAKLFTLTTAAGVRTDYLHHLTPGEMPNNSFATVAPGGRWFVSGEWGQMTRLLVFATPHPAATRTPPRPLPLATTISLTHPVRNVQGCAFTSSASLICSTNDSGTDLYPVPRQLVTISLARPLDGHPVTGTPQLLGAVPAQTVCPGPAGEVEGIDVHTNRLVVAVNAPCAASTQLFSYDRLRPGAPTEPITSWTQPCTQTQGTLPGRTNPQTTHKRNRS